MDLTINPTNNPDPPEPPAYSNFGFSCSNDLGFQIVASLLTSQPAIRQAQLQSVFFRHYTSPAYGLFLIDFRQGGALRWLLVMAGDIELNPGPARSHAESQSTDYNDDAETVSPPSKRRNCIKAYECICEDHNARNDDIICVECNRGYHRECLVKTTAKSDYEKINISAYQCKYCEISMRERFAGGTDIEVGSLEEEISQVRCAYSTILKKYDALLLGLKGTTDRKCEPKTESRPCHRISIVKGKWNPLSNFFRFTFVFRGVIFDSAEKAYQYFKAMRIKKIELCKRILAARSPSEAKRLGSEIGENDENGGANLEQNLPLMSEILQEKAKQCKPFRSELRKLKDVRIMHSTYTKRDSFWTTGLDYRDEGAHQRYLDHSEPSSGLNAFGYLLEFIRDRLDDESEYDSSIDVVETPNFVYICEDGEVPMLPKPRLWRQDRRRCYACSAIGHIARNCHSRQQRYKESYVGPTDRVFHSSTYGKFLPTEKSAKGPAPLIDFSGRVESSALPGKPYPASFDSRNVVDQLLSIGTASASSTVAMEEDVVEGSPVSSESTVVGEPK
jgi:ribA/ribD-fused uncharacterized protein